MPAGVVATISAVELPANFLSWLGPTRSCLHSEQKNPGILEGVSGVNLFLSLIPSYMENLAFAILSNVEQLVDIARIPPRRIILTGGGSANPILISFLSRILPTDKFFITVDAETTSKGAVFSAVPESEKCALTPLEAVECGRNLELMKKYELWKGRLHNNN